MLLVVRLGLKDARQDRLDKAEAEISACLHKPLGITNVLHKRVVNTSEWLTFAELYPYIQISGLIQQPIHEIRSNKLY
jgi:hypothetical protein